MRIRLKSDALDTKEQGNGQQKPTDGDGSAENADSTATNADPDDSEESDSTNDATTTPEAGADSNAASENNKPQKKAGHLLGKINNLITTDLAAIGNVHIILSLREANPS